MVGRTEVVTRRHGEPHNTWLMVTRQALWDQFKTEGEWAFHHQSTPQARRIAPGDLGVVYLTKHGTHSPSRIVGLVEFTQAGRPSISPDAVEAFYPFHVPFRLLVSLREPVEFATLALRLQFTGGRARYGVFLQGKSAIRLSAADASTISMAVESSSGRQIRPQGRHRSRNPT